jgi:hypothetical protein
MFWMPLRSSAQASARSKTHGSDTTTAWSLYDARWLEFERKLIRARTGEGAEAGDGTRREIGGPRTLSSFQRKEAIRISPSRIDCHLLWEVDARAMKKMIWSACEIRISRTQRFIILLG